MIIKFERILSSSNLLLQVQEFEITRTRDRSQNAENRREQIFEFFIARESSQFERVEMKTAIFNNEEISAKIKRVIHRVDLVSDRERDCDRERERGSERSRER